MYSFVPHGKERCFHCGELYDPKKELGSLNCFFHPSNPSSRTGVYPCCGATVFRCNETENWPPGCHQIDHSSCLEERKDTRMNPYVFVPASEASVVFALRSDSLTYRQHRFFHSSQDLTRSLKWQGPLGEYTSLDLFEKYEELKAAVNQRALLLDTSNPASLSTSRYYLYPSYSKKDAVRSLKDMQEENKFIPFYVVRTCATQVDPSRRKLFSDTSLPEGVYCVQ